MGSAPQLTTQTIRVLSTLMNNSPDALSGAEIGRTTKLKSGTLYPILLRLEKAGWLESFWESESPQDLGRPRRRFYKLTALGARNARSGVRELRAAIGEPAWERR